MKMNDVEHLQWKETASDNELRLLDRISDFGEYFEDMLFEKDSLTGRLIRCQECTSDKWTDTVVDLPEQLRYFSYNFFKFEVKPLSKDYAGFYDKNKQLLCISTDDLEKDYVILHEMIHMHEAVINELPLFYHDALLWSLYTDLSSRLNNLDSAILEFTHILDEQAIYANGGLHDLLFLLKSIDLDIRKNYSLGTVLSYGMKSIFKDITYKK